MTVQYSNFYTELKVQKNKLIKVSFMEFAFTKHSSLTQANNFFF